MRYFYKIGAPCLWILCFLFYMHQAFAQSSNDSWAEANEWLYKNNAWHSPAWLKLLHFNNASGKSRIVSKTFFLSESGDSDPIAEGVETLIAIYFPADKDKSIACRYPARVDWIRSVLAGKNIKLPTLHCQKLHKWLQSLQAKSLTLVFPQAYLNNPASMFGHSLLRVDSSRYSNSLLAPSISYAAVVENAKGIGYAVRGIFGGYRGRFSIFPYADLVKRYGAMENRDIWEYHLSFSRREIHFLLKHVWELRHVEFNYYFFRENCAFQLLAILEAARPSLQMTTQFPWWTLPVDSIRELVNQNLVNKVHLRPSRGSQIMAYENKLNSNEITLARSLCLEKKDITVVGSLLPTRQATIMDLAIQCHLYNQTKYNGKENAYSLRLHKLLTARNRIDRNSIPVTVNKTRPDDGHKSHRMQLVGGMDGNDRVIDINIRPALHGLTDPTHGYLQGARIETLQPKFRYVSKEQKWKLQSLNVINISSLTPRTQMVRPYSWRINLLTSRSMDDSKWETYSTVGLGWSWPIQSKSSFYFITELQGRMASTFSTALGASSGLISHYGAWSAAVNTTFSSSIINDSNSNQRLMVYLGKKISRQQVIFSEFNQQKRDNQLRTNYGIGWSIYY